MHPQQLKEAFARGENITELLRGLNNSEVNTEEIIATTYDFQAGSYVAALNDPDWYQWNVDYGRAIGSELQTLIKDGGSVLEPGIGEGSTWSFVKTACEDSFFTHHHGFDISWSRIAQCRKWLQSQEIDDTFLSIASIFHAPYTDDSFDVVYTSHTMEPNGGSEIPILKELYRIANKYLVLIEPSFEFGSAEAQERMQRLGYVRGLADHAESLGMNVVRHELHSVQGNPLNPTSIIVIEKNEKAAAAVPQLACPRFGDLLTPMADAWYSTGSLRAYPMIGGIPCLRREDGVIASQFESMGEQL